jgi:hypothetical protein
VDRIRTLVDGHRAPGVYRWDAGMLPGTAAAMLARSRRPVVVLDGRFARDKTSLLDEVTRALALRDHIGHNWDAMGDGLRDLGPGTVLIWDRADVLALLDRMSFDTAVDILVTASFDGLTTLLRGAPPGLPLL